MKTIASEDCVVIKTLNNNTIVAMDNGMEKVIIAKGIAFQVKPGGSLPKGIVAEKVFSIVNEETQDRYNQLLVDADLKLVGVCTEAIHVITERVGIHDKLGETALLSLTDHLVFAVERLKRNETIRNPFIHEVRILYPVEYQLASEVAGWLGEMLKLEIPDNEIGFMALHIHSLLTNRTVSQSLFIDTVIMEVNTAIEKVVGTVNRSSLEYARFITHMRFVMNRLLQNVVLTNGLKDVIAERYQDSYALAEQVSHIIHKRLKKVVSTDEIAYIAIHIENVRRDREKEE